MKYIHGVYIVVCLYKSVHLACLLSVGTETCRRNSSLHAKFMVVFDGYLLTDCLDVFLFMVVFDGDLLTDY